MQKDQITFETNSRRFGVEIEYNSFDKMSRTLGDLPAGIHSYANVIANALKCRVNVDKYHLTSNNKDWVLKPDSSCGIEVCSPPLRGVYGLKSIYNAIKALTEKNISADKRCSLHVHIEIADFEDQDIINLLSAWTSHELFFFFLTNIDRWMNPYCQPMGFYVDFSCFSNKMTKENVLDLFGNYKYSAINLGHYKNQKSNKKTIEFRIMGNEGCLCPDTAVIWCKILLCFVDNVKNMDGIIDNIEYKNVTETLEFLNLQNYFKNKQEIQCWLIERFSRLIDNEKLFDNDSSKIYIWQELVGVLQKDFKVMIDKLEEQLT